MEGGFLDHTPAWRTYHYTGKKKEKVIAGEATAQQLIAVLEEGEPQVRDLLQAHHRHRDAPGRMLRVAVGRHQLG